MVRIFLVLLITFVVSYDLPAQNYFFAEAKENEISATQAGKRVIVPEKYRSLVLDTRGMQDFLNLCLPKAALRAETNPGFLNCHCRKVEKLPIEFGRAR
jgi:hypothetical protein